MRNEFCHGLPSESTRSEMWEHWSPGFGSSDWAASVNQQRSPCDRDACLRLSAAVCTLPASLPPPPGAAVLLCNHITRSNSISPSLKEIPLTHETLEEQGQSHRVPGPLEVSSASNRSGGGEGEKWRCKDRRTHTGGGDKIYIEKGKGEG